MPRLDGRWQSIERKLPLLIAALVLGTVLAFSWATYVRVERLLLAGTVSRMQDGSAAIARMIEQSGDSDKASLAQLARDSTVRQFLITGRGAAAAREALWAGLARTPNERGRIELRNAAGLTILDTAQGAAPPGSGWVDRVIASRTLGVGQAIVGPLHVSGGSAYKEALVAVPATRESAGSDVLGYVSAATFLTAHSVRTIRDLIGLNADLRVGSPSNGVWTDLEAVSPPPPAQMQIGHTAVFDKGIGTAVGVLGTPWVVWVSQPRATIFAPTQSLLGELAVLALFFVVLGALGAGVLGRQISRPIAALADATEQVAIAGTPSPPLKAGSRDEVARLRESFGRMAARINESRTKLEQQIEEAHSLARGRAAVNADLRAAIAAADEARDAAEAANRIKSDFLAVLSQEVRTPLNAIIGYVELLRAGLSGPVTTDQKEKLARVRSSADELLHLVNQLLDVERIGSSGEPVRIELTDIGGLMRGATADVERKALDRGLTLVVEEPNPPLVVSVDASKLRQILVNLLSNAVKYTEHGGVRMRARVIDGMLSVAVQDTGIGIQPAHQTRIFEPFWQADQRLTRKVGGAGLGLTIVKQLIQLLDGDITIDSTPGQGSTFTLQLPVPAPQLAAA